MKIKLVEMRVAFIGDGKSRVDLHFDQNSEAFTLRRTYEHSELVDISHDVIELEDRLNRFFESNKLELIP